MKQKIEIKVPSITCCPVCGMETDIIDVAIQPLDYLGIDRVNYKVVNRHCPRCGNVYQSNATKDIL